MAGLAVIRESNRGVVYSRVLKVRARGLMLWLTLPEVSLYWIAMRVCCRSTDTGGFVAADHAEYPSGIYYTLYMPVKWVQWL